jgi:hypothetical protein
MVKELVQGELEVMVKTRHARPSVICDCVILDGAMRSLLIHGAKVTSIVAAYRGEPGYAGIAERADTRAKDVTAPPADKGRFYETTSLLRGHADASQRLLSSIPDGILTAVYDTNVERGSDPKKIADIDSKTHVVEISNLRVMSEFLNKKNINIAAVNQVDLIYRTDDPLNLLATHPENKAKAILDLIPATKFKSPYTVRLKSVEGVVYAELTPDEKGCGASFNVINRDIFVGKAKEDTIEAMVLRAMYRQVQVGGIVASLAAAYQDGDKPSFLRLVEDQRAYAPTETVPTTSPSTSP